MLETLVSSENAIFLSVQPDRITCTKTVNKKKHPHTHRKLVFTLSTNKINPRVVNSNAVAQRKGIGREILKRSNV